MKYPYSLLAGLLAALVLAPAAMAGEKTIVGWIEKVRLYPGDLRRPCQAGLGGGVQFPRCRQSHGVRPRWQKLGAL